MRKKSFFVVLVVLYMWQLSACTQIPSDTPTWQEQYDLGIRYLSEGNYEEAIIAFTAAIEIDPKQALAYVGRGDAYVASGEIEGNWAMAQADYDKAIELDGAMAEVYIKLANVYVRQGEHEKALEVLRRGLELTENNSSIADKIAELEEETDKLEEPVSYYNPYGAVEFTLRDEYRDAESLTDEELSVMKAAMAFTESGNTQELYQLGQQYVATWESSTTWYDILTILDGYKIWFHIFDSNQIRVEMRPENGIGYCAWTDRESHGEWASCLCTDWQWNGTMTETEAWGDVRTIWTGPMENNLRNGAFEQTYISDNHTATWKTTYRDGVWVDFDGKPQEPSDTLWTIIGGRNPKVSDELYW